ncbi:hypothetical protein BJV82DRAFT_665175 [Fennellomyces sp. T-0311]|nr:hypothetical protein BJV82DRAFT_665175 [Fennellomyces sp. T-0311]
MTHSFINHTYGLNTPSSSTTTVETPESGPETQQQQQEFTTRRYVQWRDEDVTVLLNDLEKPGHYESWKNNKSGYSKRVAEEVFRNIMYHEAIKFKVRWLEARYKKWEEQLTAPDVIDNEQAKAKLTEKMRKDFTFYDRCKRVFSEDNNGDDQTQEPAPEATSPEPKIQHTPSPPTTTNTSPAATVTIPRSSGDTWQAVPADVDLMPRAPPATLAPGPSSTTDHLDKYTPPSPHAKRRKTGHRISDGIAEERQLKVMEMELMAKRMEHEERMQQMKLEQLRLEIELEKIRSGASN